MAERDFYKEAMLESDVRSSMLRWMQARTEAIRRQVTAHDVLRRNGIKLLHSTDREEQFPCPFHGVDRHPSARVYTESPRGPSHVWCFTCRQRWDAIALWKLFSGGADVKFSRVLKEIELAYGIIPPERPPSAAELANEEDPEELECIRLIDACESRLVNAKTDCNIRALLTLGSILDRVRYQFEERQLSPTKAKEVLLQILSKIGEKTRHVPPVDPTDEGTW